MRRALACLAGLSLLSGCVAYPRPYLTRVRGRADLDGGPPVRIQAGISKDCDTVQGETEEIKGLRETTTDKDGRYSLTVYGVVWHFKNYFSLTECTSHIQRFVCRAYCKKADDVDLEMLGK